MYVYDKGLITVCLMYKEAITFCIYSVQILIRNYMYKVGKKLCEAVKVQQLAIFRFLLYQTGPGEQLH